MLVISRAAIHTWGKQAFTEILNVDKSREMNNLSQLILQGGQPNKPPLVHGVVYRQFMPHGREVYSLRFLMIYVRRKCNKGCFRIHLILLLLIILYSNSKIVLNV